MRAAVHIRTAGFYCGACPKVVEKAIAATEGVIDVVAVRSMGLTSVLYDTEMTDRETLCARIRMSGFPAEVLGSGDFEHDPVSETLGQLPLLSPEGDHGLPETQT
jgi:copper chaperone CopZ